MQEQTHDKYKGSYGGEVYMGIDLSNLCKLHDIKLYDVCDSTEQE